MTTSLQRLLLATFVISHWAFVIPSPAATDAQLAVVAAHIQEGDTAAARAELDRLLKAEPDDATLKTLRAQLGGATANPATATPAMSATERLEMNSIIIALKDEIQISDPKAKKEAISKTFAKAPRFPTLNKEQIPFWSAIAWASLSIDDWRNGWAAGTNLKRLGLIESTDQQHAELMARLHNKGWLAEKTDQLLKNESIAELSKYTGHYTPVINYSAEHWGENWDGAISGGTGFLTMSIVNNQLKIEGTLTQVAISYKSHNEYIGDTNFPYTEYHARSIKATLNHSLNPGETTLLIKRHFRTGTNWKDTTFAGASKDIYKIMRAERFLDKNSEAKEYDNLTIYLSTDYRGPIITVDGFGGKKSL